MRYNGENHMVLGLHEDPHFKKERKDDDEEVVKRFYINEVRAYVVEAESKDEAVEKLDLMDDSELALREKSRSISYIEEI